MSIEEIAAEIKDCKRCSLWETRNRAVPGRGDVHAEIMMIGEAPGKKEDELGMPFTGAAGRILDEMLAQADLKRDEIFITSVIKCRPPKNRNPKAEELLACGTHLKKQVSSIKPKIICILGNVALHMLIEPNLPIGSVRGRILKKEQQRYYPVYHPAAVLYNRNLEEVLRKDFETLPKLVNDIR